MVLVIFDIVQLAVVHADVDDGIDILVDAYCFLLIVNAITDDTQTVHCLVNGMVTADSTYQRSVARRQLVPVCLSTVLQQLVVFQYTLDGVVAHPGDGVVTHLLGSVVNSFLALVVQGLIALGQYFGVLPDHVFQHLTLYDGSQLATLVDFGKLLGKHNLIIGIVGSYVRTTGLLLKSIDIAAFVYLVYQHVFDRMPEALAVFAV